MIWKDYRFYVKCNEHPTIIVKVVAENEEKAIRFAKNSYSANYSIYTDERCNKWEIKDEQEKEYKTQ